MLRPHVVATAVLAAFTLQGCVSLPTAGGSQSYVGTAEPTVAERDLQQRTLAYQRTLVEATASGAFIGGFIGGPRQGGAAIGAVYGAGVGLFAGTYVAYLQQEYATRESQLEELSKGLRLVNDDLAATINTMRAVVAEQRGTLAQIAADANLAGRRAQETADTQANLGNMQRIIEGATQWQSQFVEARSLAQTPAEQAQIDPELARLSERIATMRQIAASLAAA